MSIKQAFEEKPWEAFDITKEDYIERINRQAGSLADIMNRITVEEGVSKVETAELLCGLFGITPSVDNIINFLALVDVSIDQAIHLARTKHTIGEASNVLSSHMLRDITGDLFRGEDCDCPNCRGGKGES